MIRTVRKEISHGFHGCPADTAVDVCPADTAADVCEALVKALTALSALSCNDFRSLSVIVPAYCEVLSLLALQAASSAWSSFTRSHKASLAFFSFSIASCA